MTELEHYIHSYFGLNKEDLAQIVPLFRSRPLMKGDYFLKAGDLVDELSFIQSGFMRVFVELNEKEITQWISSKGSFITDLRALVFNSSSRWNIQALTDTEIYSISKADYNHISDHVPTWPVLEKYFIVQCFGMMEERILSHLSMSAEERYQFFFDQNKELFNQVPLQYLASMLGMTPETFSRIRKKQT